MLGEICFYKADFTFEWKPQGKRRRRFKLCFLASLSKCMNNERDTDVHNPQR